MAKRPSKKSDKKPAEAKKVRFKRTKGWIAKIKSKRSGRVRLHKTFRRSYREDYRRELEIPGMFAHAVATFKAIFKNWKIFLGLLVLAVFLNVLLVGIMNEATYKQFKEVLDETSAEFSGGEISNVMKASLILISTVTTGGLSGESSESAVVFSVLIFLLIWLCTIFILRHRYAGHTIKLRDALYNAATPLVSTLMVFLLIFIQCIPLFILLIVYATAVATGFLSTPFYALVFFIFAMAMILLSGYLLSSSIIALVAVSAPGLYPLKAVNTASDLMAGRRMRFIFRIIFLIFALAIMWVFVMIPIILLDFWLKGQFGFLAGVPVVPIALLVMTCFTAIYTTAYLYIYYRWMLDYDEK